MKIVSRHYRKANFVVDGLQCRIIVVYHVEIPRPFINLPHHIWSCYGSFKGKLQQFSVLCNFPVKKPIKLPFMVRGGLSFTISVPLLECCNPLLEPLLHLKPNVIVSLSLQIRRCSGQRWEYNVLCADRTLVVLLQLCYKSMYLQLHVR